jgi:hypothetical protein
MVRRCTLALEALDKNIGEEAVLEVVILLCRVPLLRWNAAILWRSPPLARKLGWKRFGATLEVAPVTGELAPKGIPVMAQPEGQARGSEKFSGTRIRPSVYSTRTSRPVVAGMALNVPLHSSRARARPTSVVRNASA